jgi:hypothetical protein
MTTLLEIKEAILQLPPGDRAILAAELFAQEEPPVAELEAALERGLRDVREGRIRPPQGAGIDNAWKETVAARVAEIREGEVHGVRGEVVSERIAKIVGR